LSSKLLLCLLLNPSLLFFVEPSFGIVASEADVFGGVERDLVFALLLVEVPLVVHAAP